VGRYGMSAACADGGGSSGKLCDSASYGDGVAQTVKSRRVAREAGKEIERGLNMTRCPIRLHMSQRPACSLGRLRQVGHFTGRYRRISARPAVESRGA